jgi:hypothetical protein
MNIGSLYKVKKYFWMLFPTNEIASEVVDVAYDADTVAAVAAHASANDALSCVVYWSKIFNGSITYFSPDSIIVFLEEDGVFKKLLTSDGRIGWTWFDESYNDSFEEVKTEE